MIKIHSRLCLQAYAVILLTMSATACTNTVVMSENTLQQGNRELNKAVVARYMSARWSDSYLSVRNETFSPDYKEVRAEFENLSYNTLGSELEAQLEPMRVSFPDRSETVDVILGEGDVVAVKYKIAGTHKGNFYGILATDKIVDINSVALFRLDDGKIIEGWFMADEVSLLRQLDTPMPQRADGETNIPPTQGLSTDTGEEPLSGDDLLKGLLASPIDSRDYRNKIKVSARKANNPPAGIIPATGRPYGKILRYGFGHFVDIGTRRGQIPNTFVQAFPDRIDKVQHLLQDGDWGVINFRVTATNTVGLYQLPPSNGPVDAWEVAFMQFDGEDWTTAWFFGDDMGLLQQLGASQDFFFPDHLQYIPLDNPQY